MLVAERAGISESMVNSVENGRSATSMEVMVRWADACGREVDIRFPRSDQD
jgi:transcriptional regulator with XRE-family HTH domain